MMLEAAVRLALTACALVAAAPVASAAVKPRPLVHPDTLPTLLTQWSLHATAAERLDPWEAPRFAVEGPTAFLHDHAASQLLAVDVASGRVRWFTTLGVGQPNPIEFTPFFLDKRLFVGAPGQLFYVHAGTGQVRWNAPVHGTPRGGAVRIADLLFFATEGGEGTGAKEGGSGVSVYALAMKAGRMLWRQPLEGAGPRLVGDGRLLYLGLSGGDLLAIDPEKGEAVWRQSLGAPALSPMAAGGRVLIAVRGGDKGPRIVVLDGATGAALWESRLPAAPVQTALLADRVLAALEDGTVTAVRAADGKAPWRTTLPLDGQLRRAAMGAHKKRLHLHVTDVEGKSLLAQIDIDSGRLLSTANGLDDAAVSAVAGDSLLLVDSADGTLHAVRLDRTRPPRRATVTGREYAEELAPLARQVGDDAEALALADKLHRLGGAALTVLTGMLQAEEPHVVAIAAIALGRLAEPRALPALRNALEKQRQQAGGGAGGVLDPVAALVRAVGATGGSSVVPALDQVLVDEALGHQVRRDAWVALGRLGNADALGALGRFRAPRVSPAAPFDPLPITVRAETRAGEDNDPQTWRDEVRAATSVQVPDPAGGLVTASLAPYLGGYNDVWIWRSPDGKSRGRPLFTGVTAPQRTPGQFLALSRLDVSGTGASLAYRVPGEDRPRQAILGWAELEADGDDDELSDRAERRLGTDPTRKDSDGDGMSDAEDNNPLAAARADLSDKQKILREVFFSYFTFFRQRGIVVVDRGVDDPLEYPGRRDPVLTLRRETIRKMQAEAGLHAIDYVGFGGPFREGAPRGGAEAGAEAQAQGEIEISQSEAHVGFDVFRGGESGVGYNVALRKIAGQWIVTAFDEAWRL